MTMPEGTRSEIRRFITDRFPKVSFSDEQDIFEMGFVNSLFAMELVMHIEQTFGLRVPNQELRRENFRSVVAMVELIDRITTDAEITVG
jgi:methoxymalonate biosynthesis acyl carrier protein